jgi:hypothetical protein
MDMQNIYMVAFPVELVMIGIMGWMASRSPVGRQEESHEQPVTEPATIDQHPVTAENAA